jgi:hypothetical protein
LTLDRAKHQEMKDAIASSVQGLNGTGGQLGERKCVVNTDPGLLTVLVRLFELLKSSGSIREGGAGLP